ncbi:HAMP domain-containing sensor histidine kinase [Streptomyces winkii]|uniref:HAMP domain-containing sensor histidine kinase n=1 Tax=Streptomyces winkii TaxID=3051178 RepID=UPI0028D05384|nr:HAMP domain-containing sensor histidine kinase [Streptomyces sp. DSM 40971]
MSDTASKSEPAAGAGESGGPGGPVPPGGQAGSAASAGSAGSAATLRLLRGRAGRMTSRTVLVTLLVALVSVLATAAAAVPLVRQAATAQARESLRDQADLAATMLAARTGRPDRVRQLAHLMRGNGIRFSLVRAHTPDRDWVPAATARRLAEGKPAHTRFTGRDGGEVLIEARPVGVAGGVVLAQPLEEARGETVGVGLALALSAGATAGTLAGVLLSRRLARPLRQAARTADRIRRGDRGCRMPLDPPDEVRELSSALNELTAALELSERRQRDFLMSVSHELRTPLTTISGYAEALADGVLTAGEDVARDAGRTILTEAGRLDRLVSDLLALARLQADDFTLDVEEVDVRALVSGAVTAWRPSLERSGTRLETELPPGPLLARTDPGRLRQVLDILVENAGRVAPGAPLVVALAPSGDAAGSGGSAGSGGAAGDAGPPGTAVPRGHFALSVRDGGPGLSDEDLLVAFERGRLHRRYHGSRPVGTGLGLALAAQLVERLGGTIAAAHAPEGGAHFTVRLPV